MHCLTVLRYPDSETLRFWRNVLKPNEFSAAVARFSKEAGSDRSQQAIMEVEQQGPQTQEAPAVGADEQVCQDASGAREVGAPFLVRKMHQASFQWH